MTVNLKILWTCVLERRQYTEKGFEEKVTVNGSRMIMSFWSLMAFILTTFYLSVQFNIFYEVTHTPIVDTGTDHMHMHKNIVVIPAAGTLSIQKGLGILDKTIVASPREMAEVYLPRCCAVFQMIAYDFQGEILELGSGERMHNRDPGEKKNEISQPRLLDY
jgi:hypothetical protein